MMKKIFGLFSAVSAAFKSVFTKKEAAPVVVVPSSEETFVEEPAMTEEKANHIIVKAAATVASLVIAYVVVCSFPLTILFVLEMMAVYKAMNWIYSKMIAA